MHTQNRGERPGGETVYHEFTRRSAFGIPDALFQASGVQREYGPFDVTEDKKRFLVNTGNPKEGNVPLTAGAQLARGAEEVRKSCAREVGYVNSDRAYAQVRGKLLVLTPGQHINDLMNRLLPNGTIAGRITDAFCLGADRPRRLLRPRISSTISRSGESGPRRRG
jgi:hypothetical protein